MPIIRIGQTIVGDGHPAYLIAEVGINHNGNPELARRLIDVAVSAEVNAVKFQKRNMSTIYARRALESLDGEDKELQYIIPHLQQAELSDDVLMELAGYARNCGVEFLCTPWDCDSVAVLERLQCLAYKVSSPDLTNLPLIECLIGTGKPLILSTGMSRLAEIERTVGFLRERSAEFALLHCHSAYPTAFKDVNLRFMERLREFGVPVGYSGHERGIAVSTAAVALGACILERHITLDRSLPGPDQAASLEPQGLQKQVRDIRIIEEALGKPERGLSRGEILNRHALAKSLAATRDIREGETITGEMIALVGPGSGLSGQRTGELIGRLAPRDIALGELFRESDITGASHDNVAEGIPFRWGQIVRFHDVEALAHPLANVLEFHLTERDLAGPAYTGPERPQELVIHAPEQFDGRLFDLCSPDARQRTRSVDLLKATFDRAEAMRQRFIGTPERLKVVVHPGGIVFEEAGVDQRAELDNLSRSLGEIGSPPGIEALLENLPPFAWAFGGQWYSTVFVEAGEIAAFCEPRGLGICLDISHAALWCNHSGSDLLDFVRAVKPFVRHVHAADASGTDGEGLQIGEGEVDLPAVLAELRGTAAAVMPEIWLGHHRDGEVAWTALARLAEAWRRGTA
jgi:N-acetylneuraminate synthase